MARPGDATLRWVDGGSPLCVVTGDIRPDLLETAARILLRYTKAASGSQCSIAVTHNGRGSRLSVVHEFDEGRIEHFRL